MNHIPKLGFLGTGWIGRNRMRAIHDSGSGEVALIYDESPETLTAALTEIPTAVRVQNYDEMLRSNLDGIVIATPTALHAEQTLLALNHKLPVFCQKPLGRNLAEVSSVVSAAKHANKLLGIDLSYRFTNAAQKIRELLIQGEIGNVYTVELKFHNAYGPDKPWFYDPTLSGGGCLLDLGIHLVDLALWMLNFPKVKKTWGSLYVKGRPLMEFKPDTAVEDFATATLILETGQTVHLSCSWGVSAGCDAVISTKFFGTTGGLCLKNVNGSFYDFKAELYRGTKKFLLTSPPDSWGGRAAIHWAKALRCGTSFSADTESLLEVARTLDTIYELNRSS